MKPQGQPFNLAFIAKAEKFIETQVVTRMTEAAALFHKRVNERTPKDTWQATASWNFTLNEKDLSYPPKQTPGIKYYDAPPSKPNKLARTMQDVYNVTNAVRHIIFLNEGSSKQAPAFFVEAEILATGKDLRKGTRISV